MAEDHRDAGLTAAQLEHLAGVYGGEAATPIAMIRKNPALGEPLVDGAPDLAVQAVYAARHEMVSTLDDVLSRRTRLRIYARDAADKGAQHVAELIAPELGWDDARIAHEVAAFRGSLTSERLAESPA